MITFYDIASSFTDITWSPNLWKTRYALNYKGIPFKTQWVEYPDIEPLCKRLGIPPTSKWNDGRPYYTLPAIHDSSTGNFISDSFLIAQYLDTTYPDTVRVIPAGTDALQDAFASSYFEKIGPALQFMLPVAVKQLNPPSEEYFTRTRLEMFGRPLQEINPAGTDRELEVWNKVRDGMDEVDQWMQKSGGPFMMGDIISFADFVMGGIILAMRATFGEESDKWQNVKSWNNGRWEILLQNLQKYE